MSGCVPGQLAPERRPTSLRNEHPVARQGQEASGNQGSQGPANENKRTRHEKRWRVATGTDLVRVTKELFWHWLRS